MSVCKLLTCTWDSLSPPLSFPLETCQQLKVIATTRKKKEGKEGLQVGVKHNGADHERRRGKKKKWEKSRLPCCFNTGISLLETKMVMLSFSYIFMQWMPKEDTIQVSVKSIKPHWHSWPISEIWVKWGLGHCSHHHPRAKVEREKKWAADQWAFPFLLLLFSPFALQKHQHF